MNITTVSMKDFSSLRIGGVGALVRVVSIKEIIEALYYARHENKKVHILGEGTNTFFGDTLETFLFIKNEIKGISFEEHDEYVLVTASAGENWDEFVQFCVNKNLSGVENLSYIPGTVGAAPVQNIGAYGVELGDVFVRLSAIDMETFDLVEIHKEACQFGYRSSLFKSYPHKYCIVSVTLKLSKKIHPVLTYSPLTTLASKENITIEEIRELVVATRSAKLPDWKVYPNCGSFFENPVIPKVHADDLRLKYPEIPLIEVEKGYKVPAAWLIEHVAGAKGVKEGDIGTWPKQPLVIVNYGHTNGEEVLALSQKIIEKIKAQTGIELRREVNYVE